MIAEKIKSILNQNFLRYLVKIYDFSFDGNRLLMNVLCVEDKGTKDIQYKLELKGITAFEFWRDDVLERGYEVDVDDITLSFANKENLPSKIEFDCGNFGLKITFSDIEIQRLSSQ